MASSRTAGYDRSNRPAGTSMTSRVTPKVASISVSAVADNPNSSWIAGSRGEITPVVKLTVKTTINMEPGPAESDRDIFSIPALAILLTTVQVHVIVEPFNCLTIDKTPRPAGRICPGDGMYTSPLIARTLGETVVARVRDDILQQELPAGTRLIDTELADRLQVSRATVRDALRQLTYEGLVTSTPHRGYFVAALSPDDVLELLDLRSLLEGRAAAEAVKNMVAEDFRRLHAILDDFERRDYYRDIIEIRDLDIAFHQTITHRSNKPLLIELWSVMNSRLFMLITICRDILRLDTQESAARHRDYIRELESGDPERARKAGEDHYQFHATRLRETLDRGGWPASGFSEIPD